jgi:hypothetical protein
VTEELERIKQEMEDRGTSMTDGGTVSQSLKNKNDCGLP